jgi:HAD superfamily hydrolase (TIGR01549 family)
VPAPSLILFDLDDTLCDYGGARTGRLRGALGNALAAAGIVDADIEAIIAESIEIHPHGSDHFPELLARHGVSDAELAQEARRWYHSNRFLGLNLFTDARAVLREVRALDGVRATGLVTNGPAEVQHAKISLLGLEAEIDFAVISGEVGVEKPDPAIFEIALERGGASAGEAIYIGDSPEYDIEGARNAGIPSVWMNRTGTPWPLETPEPRRQVATLRAFVDLLKSRAT